MTCVIGVARQATTLKTATSLAIADTAYNMAMMELTAFVPTISAMSMKTARFTPLTPTLSVVTVWLLTVTLMSKGC